MQRGGGVYICNHCKSIYAILEARRELTLCLIDEENVALAVSSDPIFLIRENTRLKD